MEHDLRELTTSAFTPETRDVLAVRQAEQDRTSEAIDGLNAAVVAAAAGREAVWRRNVADALEILSRAVATDVRSCMDVEGLLGDIARTQPRLRNRVRGLRQHYVRLSGQIEDTLRTLTGRDDVGIAETRVHVGSLISALQVNRGRESDLIYEAYFDAFNRDVEEELLGARPDPSAAPDRATPGGASSPH